MRVLSYNVHGWRTVAGEPNAALVAAVVAASGADLVGLNEVFDPAPDTGSAVLASLAQQLGLSFAFGPTQPADATALLSPYGNALLSRWPIQAFAVHHLAPATAYGRRGLLEVRLAPSAPAPLTVYVTHLDHREEEVRLKQWQAAQGWLDRDRHRPHILLGDFNALARSDYAAQDRLEALQSYHRERGWPEPAFELIDRVLKAGYVDAFSAAGQGPGPTYPSSAPERRIDYLFVPALAKAAITRCRAVDSPGARAASDHLPVEAEIHWT